MSSASRRPYLIRAIYDWSVDNGLTPHVLVAADEPSVEMPRDTMREGKVALNIAPSAVRDIMFGDDSLSFKARFSGRSFSVNVPTRAVLAVYARENGEGIVFGDIESPEPPDSPDGGPDKGAETPSPKPHPHLRVVK